MLPENFGHNDWKIFHSILDPNAGTMTVLMDASLRYRQFCQTSRLSLPMKIAPIPLGLLVEEPFDGKNETKEILDDLARYVEYLVTHENIEIPDVQKSFLFISIIAKGHQPTRLCLGGGGCCKK